MLCQRGYIIKLLDYIYHITYSNVCPKFMDFGFLFLIYNCIFSLIYNIGIYKTEYV